MILTGAPEHQRIAEGFTPDDWFAYYQQLPLKELKRVAGESMCLSTSGTKAQILERILDKMTTPRPEVKL